MMMILVVMVSMMVLVVMVEYYLVQRLNTILFPTRLTQSSIQPAQLTFLFILGFYMYVTSLTGISGSQAVLKSPVYQKASTTCVFEFYYKMTSTFSETLTLYLNSGSRKTAIWTRSGKNSGKIV